MRMSASQIIRFSCEKIGPKNGTPSRNVRWTSGMLSMLFDEVPSCP